MSFNDNRWLGIVHPIRRQFENLMLTRLEV